MVRVIYFDENAQGHDAKIIAEKKDSVDLVYNPNLFKLESVTDFENSRKESLQKELDSHSLAAEKLEPIISEIHAIFEKDKSDLHKAIENHELNPTEKTQADLISKKVLFGSSRSKFYSMKSTLDQHKEMILQLKQLIAKYDVEKSFIQVENIPEKKNAKTVKFKQDSKILWNAKINYYKVVN